MKAHLIKLRSSGELAGMSAHVGCYAQALPYFENRREMLEVCVTDVPSPAASIIKQEALSRGGDAAVHARVITCGVERSEVVIFGTRKCLCLLADKLSLMPWWGLAHLADEIRALVKEQEPRAVVLPCGRALEFGRRMLVMGIINLTDDSFYEGSRAGADVDDAVRRAVRMAEDGADMLDLGAESTRPGSSRVPEAQELARMTDAVRAIRKALPHMPLSIDTTRASVARAALDAGADIINDVSGLQFDPGVATEAAQYGAMLVLMHMRGTPADMQSKCSYRNLISEVCDFLQNAALRAQELGVAREHIIVDPGIGFAKDYNQNLFLLLHCESFKALGYPLLVGASRKGVISRATQTPDARDRMPGTLAVTALCCAQRADVIRVHDVKENKQAIMMTEAIMGAEYV